MGHFALTRFLPPDLLMNVIVKFILIGSVIVKVLPHVAGDFSEYEGKPWHDNIIADVQTAYPDLPIEAVEDQEITDTGTVRAIILVAKA